MNNQNQDQQLNETNGVSEPKLPKAIKVQVSVLCGRERDGWVEPDLYVASHIWAVDERVDPERGGKMELYPVRGYGTSQEARNAACEAFLESDCEYLLMVDNDTVPVHPVLGEYMNLLALADWELDIVAAVVPTIRPHEVGGGDVWALNAYVREGTAFRALSLEELSQEGGMGYRCGMTPVREVDAVGFGAVILSHRVVEAMTKYDKTYWDGPEDLVEIGDYYPSATLPYPPVLRTRDLGGRTLFGEDMLFCWRAKDLGFKSYTAPAMYCDHAHTLRMGKLPMTKMAHSPNTTAPTKEQLTAQWQAAYQPNQDHLKTKYGLSHLPAEGMPEITDWSIEPELAHYLRNYIEQRHGIKVLELGSGISTVVMWDSLPDDNSFVVSLEHDAVSCCRINGYLSINNHDMPAVSGLNQAVVLSDLREQPDGGWFYNWSWPTGEPWINLLLIDGPPAKYQGRKHAAQFLPQVKIGGLVIMDDYEREHEKKACDSWIEQGLVYAKERVGRARVMVRTSHPIPVS